MTPLLGVEVSVPLVLNTPVFFRSRLINRTTRAIQNSTNPPKMLPTMAEMVPVGSPPRSLEAPIATDTISQLDCLKRRRNTS